MPKLRFLIVTAAAVLVALPAAAAAAVPRQGNVFSPRTAAELLEAADAITAEGASAMEQFELRLSAEEYLIDRPLVISARVPVMFEAPEGHVLISNSGTPGPLLVMTTGHNPSYENNLSRGYSGLEFRLRGATSSAFALVELRSGGGLTGAHVGVPAGAPNVTGVALRAGARDAWPQQVASLRGASVTSHAATAPAVQAAPGAMIIDSEIIGDARALHVVDGADAGTREVAVYRSTLDTQESVAGGVVRVEPGSGLRLTLSSTIVEGRGTGALIDVAPGSVATNATRLVLRNLTLVARGGAGLIGADMAALRVASSAAAQAPVIDAAALLSLGSVRLLECGGDGAVRPLVRINAFHAAGALGSHPGCDVTATGAVTGDPKLLYPEEGDYALTWGSPLIDRTTEAVAGLSAADGMSHFDWDWKPRLVYGHLAPDPRVNTPLDIGALEYQVTLPEIEVADAEAIGNRGLVLLTAWAFDPSYDEAEWDAVTYAWRLADGTLLHGGELEHRFDGPQTITLIVTDVTGRTVERDVDVRPVIRLDQPSSEDGDGGGLPGYDLPRPPYVPPTRLAPKLRPVPPRVSQVPTFTTLKLKRATIARSARGKIAYGKAKRGEGVLQLTLARETKVVLTISRKKGRKWVKVRGAVQSLAARSGTQTIRLTSRFGKKRLARGSYRMAVRVSGVSLEAETKTVTIRVR